MLLRAIIILLCLGLFDMTSDARMIKITMYGDGFSCPGNCDAHVVFDNKLNGTFFAHTPSTKIAPFKDCENNSECRICFSESESQCLTVMYRGAGPLPWTFDFTPAFFEEYCAKDSIPQLLAVKCAALNREAKSLSDRKNCIRQSDTDGCSEIIKVAKDRKSADQPAYDKCKSLGEDKFNKGLNSTDKRTNDCNYSKYRDPRRSKKLGLRLLPAACPPNTYVGRDGLDCCTGIILADGPLGVECDSFYPKK